MSVHSYLLTYSVTSTGSGRPESADVIRRRIAELDGLFGWKKLRDVETAFAGTTKLGVGTNQEKLNAVVEDVKKVFNNLYDADYPSSSAIITVALLVDGLGEVREFLV
ncbi:hypothetical protein LJQ78_002459 [Acinetobacter baumannii]|nr:hypothetical protein [Acinetobacter baumannii]